MDHDHPSVKAYENAVAGAPEEIRSKVSPFRSTGDHKSGLWTLRDADGVVLWQQPALERPAADPKPPQRGALEKRLDLNRKFTLQAAEAIQLIAERLVQMKAQLDGIQARVDQERRGIAFRGSWQPAIDYEPGSIVTYGERAYVSLKAVRPGGQPPSRHGAGWIHMFHSTEVPK